MNANEPRMFGGRRRGLLGLSDQNSITTSTSAAGSNTISTTASGGGGGQATALIPRSSYLYDEANNKLSWQNQQKRQEQRTVGTFASASSSSSTQKKSTLANDFGALSLQGKRATSAFRGSSQSQQQHQQQQQQVKSTTTSVVTSKTTSSFSWRSPQTQPRQSAVRETSNFQPKPFRQSGSNNANAKSSSSNEAFSATSSSSSFASNARVNMRKLAELSDKPPQDIILRLCNPTFGLDSCLSAATLGDDMVKRLVSLLERSLECHSLDLVLADLLVKVAKSRFFQAHVYALMSQRVSPTVQLYDYKLVKSVLNICCRLLELAPTSVSDIAIVRDRLELLICMRMNEPELVDEFRSRFVRLEEAAQRQSDAMRNHRTFRNETAEWSSSDEPPDDFTSISVVPRMQDILHERAPYLRKNVTSGPFQSVRHYLDVQFRLLREDYMQPLREGVQKFRAMVTETSRDGAAAAGLALATANSNSSSQQQLQFHTELKRKLAKIESLSVYFQVLVESSMLNNNGLIYRMKLANLAATADGGGAQDKDTTTKKKNKKQQQRLNVLESGKKLMFGSLVCLSSDFFQRECLIGIICERKSEESQMGLVNVKFDYDFFGGSGGDTNSNNTPCRDRVYVMLETSAFFESYKHVLMALQTFAHEPDEEFPFRKHLIECDNREIERPDYLNNVIFDFRPIVDNAKKIVVTPVASSNSRGGGGGFGAAQVPNASSQASTYEFSDEVRWAERCVLTDESTWPNAEQMRLDASQYDALKLALTSKLALIQGFDTISFRLLLILLHISSFFFCV